MADETKDVGDEILSGASTALQTLLFGMLEKGNRHGSLHVRPTINGTPAPYSLRFDVTATLVPDKPLNRRRRKL